jgi:hypothetical protein
MKAKLAELGYTREQIRNMRPDEAIDIIKAGTHAPADREALDTTEAIDMASPRKIDAESRSDAPGDSTADVVPLRAPNRPLGTKPAAIGQPYTSKLEAALDHARCGFPVFPCKPYVPVGPKATPKQRQAAVKKAKEPAIKGWQAAATTDEAQIRSWWREDPGYNIGIFTDRLLVVDIDLDKGGNKTFEALAKAHDFPPTRISKTRSGGLHRIYGLEPGVSVKGSAGEIGEGDVKGGVDIRSAGNLIVAPGSSIEDKFYVWQNSFPVAPAPQWLIELCGRAKPRGENAGKRLIPEDETVVQLAREWMNRQPAVEVGKIDDTQFAMAAKCGDYGCTADTIEELLTEWCMRHDIPTAQERLGTIARSSLEHRQRPIGILSAHGFEAIEIPEWPKPDKKTNAGEARTESSGTASPEIPPILTLAQWRERDLPEPDYLMGQWLTTTSRVILNAATGLGKSMLVIGLGMSGAAGNDFLHWAGVRPATVLYIDGEMSRRLLKQRLADGVKRLGTEPKGFHALSREDVDGFAPLNTKPGQEIIDRVIKRIGSVDLVIFDNIMSLTSGSMSDEESWAQTMPWIRHLTAKGIGQLWVHHTGHNKSRGFGTSTREWQMDTVIQLDEVERPDTDVSFQLKFPKARERTPATRMDFADTKIALVNDKWTSQSAEGKRLGKLTPTAAKFLEALRNAARNTPDGDNAPFPHVPLEAWKNECFRQGLIERDKDRSASSMLSTYKRQLSVANYIACDETTAQLL